MKKFLFIFLLFFGFSLAFCQIKFESSAPLSVFVGERFRIEYTLTNAQGSNFVSPSVVGAEVLAGPSIANGSQITIINGKQSSTITQTYTFILYSSESGTVKVGGATLLANGKSYSAKPFTIDVAASGSSGGNSAAGVGGGTVSSSDVMLRTEVSKTSVYKGEAILVYLKMYARVSVVNAEDAKYAAFNGFWKQELSNDAVQPSRVTIDGKSYTGQVIRQWLVFPQKAGTLEIEQNEFTAIVQVLVDNSGVGSLMEEFFGGMQSVDYVKKRIVSPSVRINVKELPKPEPANFSGAVGNFTMEASLSGGSIPVNSGGNITVKLSGDGNFPLITAEEFVLPAAFEKYDVKIKDDITYSQKGASGTKSFEYPFITRAEGDYRIAPIEFSYFDVSSGRYKSLNSGSFNVKIVEGDGRGHTTGAFISGVTKEDLKMLGQDIRFIKTGKVRLTSIDDRFLWSVGFFVAFGLIVVLFISLLLLSRRMISQRADVAKVKNKKANKVALRRLRRSKTYKDSGDKDKFYEEMLRALWGYIGDKLAIEVADLTKDRVRASLLGRGVAQDHADAFLDLIGKCEFAQYSPSDTQNMNILYESALDIIGNMEVK